MRPTFFLFSSAMILLIVISAAQGTALRRDSKGSDKDIISSVKGGKGGFQSGEQPKLHKKEKGDDPSHKGRKLTLPSKSTKAAKSMKTSAVLKVPKSSKTSLKAPKPTMKSLPSFKAPKAVKSSKGSLSLKSVGKDTPKPESESKGGSRSKAPTTIHSPAPTSLPSSSFSPSQELSSPTQGPNSNPVPAATFVTVNATLFSVEYDPVVADEVTEAEINSVTDFLCVYLAGIAPFQRTDGASVECGPHEANIGIYYEKIRTTFAATFTEDTVPSQMEVDGAIEKAILDPAFLSGVQALGGSFANTEEILFFAEISYTIDPYTVSYVSTEGPASDLETDLAGNMTCKYLTEAVLTGPIYTFRSNVGASVECTFAANADMTPLEIVYDTVYTFERQDEQSAPDQVSIKDLPSMADVEASIQAVFSDKVNEFPDGPPLSGALQDQLPDDNPYAATTGFLIDGDAIN